MRRLMRDPSYKAYYHAALHTQKFHTQYLPLLINGLRVTVFDCAKGAFVAESVSTEDN